MLRDASQRNHARDPVWHMPRAAMLLSMRPIEDLAVILFAC
jgi:hypothetical protein